MALLSIINSLGETLFLYPGFLCYESDFSMADGISVSAHLFEKNVFGYDVNIVMSHITDKSRVIAVECDFIVICDEVCEKS